MEDWNGMDHMQMLSLVVLPFLSPSLPLTHSQRSKNGKSPGWRSCWVGLGRDSRYVTSNGGFGQSAYTHGVSTYEPGRVQYGVACAVCGRCRETLGGICVEHPQLCFSSRPAHCSFSLECFAEGGVFCFSQNTCTCVEPG